MDKCIRSGFRTLIIVLLISVLVENCYSSVQGEAGTKFYFLFDKIPWLLFMAAFIGIFVGGVLRRTDPFIEGIRVWRHDKVAMLSHWTHALGCILLLLSGFALGFFSFPRFFSGPTSAAWLMNLHFIGALLFVFGGFFWTANMVVSPKRLIEHLPDAGSLSEAVTHYAHLFKLTNKEVAPGKYHGSERLAFVPIVLVTLTSIVSGFFKVAARLITLSPDLQQLMTWIHGVSTLLILVLLIAHIVMGALVPWSWPLLGSMFRGHVSLKYAEKNHKAWIGELSEKHQEEGVS